MKIVSSGKVLNSREFYEKKIKRRRIRLIFLSVGVLVILLSLIYLSRQERFLITEIAVPGESVSGKEEIREHARQSLAGYYLRVFPRSNSYIYPRRRLEESLVKKFPKLKSVDLDLSDVHTLLVNVEERVPFGLYCMSSNGLANVSGCFFIDDEGFIFEAAPSFSNGVYFIYATGDPIKNPLGKRFLPVQEFQALSKYIEALATLDIQPSMLKVTDDEYTLYLPNGAEILWRRYADFALIRSNLEAFLSEESIREQSDFLDRIAQLDLRIENKVFYKFKD